MKAERGTVVRVYKELAYVRFCGGGEDCGGCKACLFTRPADGMDEPVHNTLNAQAGDEVEVVRRKGRSMPAVVLFGLPILVLIAMAALVSILSGGIEWLVAVAALVSAVAVFVPMVALDKYLVRSGRLGGRMVNIIAAGTDDNRLVNE